jgi:REP element-mobilizing transposase RayT
MSRGIEKSEIFRCSTDMNNFVHRLERCVKETGITVIAWALMPNHIHLLARTGRVPLWKFMQKLLTGHAIYFNRKHDRVGHLFQNRYLSILVQSEVYLLALIRYIHMNPLKANLVKDIEALGRYPWTSHFGLINQGTYPWQDTAKSLIAIYDNKNDIMKRYGDYFAEDAVKNDHESLERGNYVLGSDGISFIDGGLKKGMKIESKYRILGSYEFAKQVYQRIRSQDEFSLRDRLPEHSSIDTVLQYATRKWKVPINLLTSGRRLSRVIKARDFVSFAFTHVLFLKLTDSARILNISTSGVRNAAERYAGSISTDDHIEECFGSHRL